MCAVYMLVSELVVKLVLAILATAVIKEKTEKE